MNELLNEWINEYKLNVSHYEPKITQMKTVQTDAKLSLVNLREWYWPLSDEKMYWPLLNEKIT